MNSTSTDQQAAVVTGAGRGIGRSVADGLVRRGYRVAALARNIAAVSDRKRQEAQAAGWLVIRYLRRAL